MAAHDDILLVDDEPVVTRAARRVLEGEGYRIDVATDGASCLELARKRRYRLALCDLMLPGVHGFELVAELALHQPDLPIVLISGYATLANAVAAFRHGAFDFIPKPFDTAELLGVTRRALDSAPARAAAPLPDTRPCYALGGHAWAAVEPEGQVKIGLGRTFAAVAGQLTAVQLPAVGDDLLQGNACIRMVSHDQLVHRVWAPLSGRVMATNDAAVDARTADRPGELCRQWLITILPHDLEHEAAQLTSC